MGGIDRAAIQSFSNNICLFISTVTLKFIFSGITVKNVRKARYVYCVGKGAISSPALSARTNITNLVLDLTCQHR